MRSRLFILVSIALTLAVLIVSWFVPRSSSRKDVREASPDQQAYDGFVRSFLDAYYAAHPVHAAALGVHRYDDRLPELTTSAVANRITHLREQSEGLATIDRSALSEVAYFDYEIVRHALLAELFDLEEVETWRHNPIGYVQMAAEGVLVLAQRDFAPLDVRLRDMTRRMDRIPAFLATARTNLDRVPPVWAKLAAKDATGAAAFLRDDLPEMVAAQGRGHSVKEEAAEWNRARSRAADAFEAFSAWLSHDPAPFAAGDFRLGKDLFERKLFLEEHSDLTAEALERMNDEAIHRYWDQLEREAARMAPGRPVREVLDAIARDHPQADALVPAAAAAVEQARAFVRSHDLLALPDAPLPVVRPTPGYLRNTFASMDTPGPLEARSLRSFYNVTTVDPAWTQEQQAQHLSYFNYPALLGTGIHEVMPGHYVQLIAACGYPSEVRKVFQTRSMVEGWAHYAEQMMVDEGMGGGDPAVRISQIRRALQRQARWHVALRLHVDGASIEEAAREFEQIAAFEPFPALRETQRATYDPTYLYYALGRMQIMALREAFFARRSAAGRPRSLRAFHDWFLAQGLPLPLAAEALRWELAP